MTLYAVDDVDDAIDATRAFLWPFDRGRWLRLAAVTFFLGGVGGVNPFQFSGGAPGGSGPVPPGDPGSLPSIGAPELALIVAIAVVVGLLALAFALVGSIMEFVFVESLRREEVTVRRYWSEHWRQGARLFGFRVALGVLSLAVAGLLVAAVLAPLSLGDGGPSIGLLLLAVPAFALFAVVAGLTYGFTTAFVVPIMLVEGRGVVAAWRRFWPTLTGQWKQYAAYAVAGVVLQFAAGVLTGVATLLGAVVIGIPLLIVGLLGAGLLSVVAVVGWGVIALAVVLFVLGVIAVGLLVAVPVQTFLRYYALFVLGDTNGEFDLIAERRRAVRD